MLKELKKEKNRWIDEEWCGVENRRRILKGSNSLHSRIFYGGVIASDIKLNDYYKVSTFCFTEERKNNISYLLELWGSNHLASYIIGLMCTRLD